MNLAVPMRPRLNAKRKRRRTASAAVFICSLTLTYIHAIPEGPTYPAEQPREPEHPHHEMDNATQPTKQRISTPMYPKEQHTSPEEAFMTWCTQVLGIRTSLEIQNFRYYDYMRASLSQQDDFCDGYETDFPMITVRGLAATQDIQVGDVVISIPFHALISVPTTIDHDPVLSGILGPAPRKTHGWDDAYFEPPLLTIAVLYHSKLGIVSPLHQYIHILVDNSDVPLLWDRERLQKETSPSVRKLVKAIWGDTREMYNVFMKILLKEHPTVFDVNDSAYSYERFQWAFAMVNSRHWYLPIPDLNEAQLKAATDAESEYGFNDQVLPASQPTEEWVREQEDLESPKPTTLLGRSGSGGSHSFLAPVADLLNFGPPCTQGRYNTESKAFEIVATCPFSAGQEVTFWYSDDCDDVIIANYGFTHPMVPKCPTADEWRQKNELWQQRAEALETALEESYKELGRMDVELEEARTSLRKCGCDEVGEAPMPRPVVLQEEPSEVVPTKLRRWKQDQTEQEKHAQHLRDGANNESTEGQARHGIRKKKWTGTSETDVGL